MALLPMPSWASHGGPEVVEVLGFDPVEEKIFFVTRYLSESLPWPGVFYFHLKGRRPSVPVRVDMRKFAAGGAVVPDTGSWAAHDPDSSLWTVIQNFRARLRPLPASPMFGAALREQRIAADTVIFADKVSRWLRLVDLADSTFSAQAEVTTYCDHRLGLESIHRLKGRSWSLVVLSFTGIPVEACYELQGPILLLPTRPPLRKLVSSEP